jgi:hypothetical protein
MNGQKNIITQMMAADSLSNHLQEGGGRRRSSWLKVRLIMKLFSYLPRGQHRQYILLSVFVWNTVIVEIQFIS